MFLEVALDPHILGAAPKRIATVLDFLLKADRVAAALEAIALFYDYAALVGLGQRHDQFLGVAKLIR